MSTKQQIAAVLDQMPEPISIEDALDRLYRAFKQKRATEANKSAAVAASSPPSQPQEQQTDNLDQLLGFIEEGRLAEARELASRLNLVHFTQVLAPPKISILESSSGRGITTQAQDAQDTLEQYAGQWVALRGGTVIGAAQRRADLRHNLEASGQLAGTVFMKVDE